MAPRKFRWSNDNGATWNEVEAELPYNIAGVDDPDTVLVEPIGVQVEIEGRTVAQNAVLTRLIAAAAATDGDNPVVNVDMASPPTITTASAHNAALTVRKYPGLLADASLFRASSGKKWMRTINNRLYMTHVSFAPSTAGSLKSSFPTAGQMLPEVPTSGYDSANNWPIEFVATNTRYVEIEHQPSNAVTPYRYIVDKAYVARDGQQVTATSNQFVTLDFGSVGDHTIIVEAQGGHLIGSISVDAGGTISAPVDDKPKAVGMGDSFWEALNVGAYGGTTKYWQSDGLGDVWAKRSGLLMRNAAIGGTGYWNESGGRRPADGYGGAQAGATRSDIVTQMEYWISDDTYDLVAFAGAFNDSGQTTDANIRILARLAWEKARLRQPNALIVVFGVWGGRTLVNDSSVRIVTEAAIKAEFDAWPDPFKLFIPVSPNFATAWLNGTGYEGATNGTGNSDTYISTDATHPNRTGHLYLGQKMDEAYRAALPGLVTP